MIEYDNHEVQFVAIAAPDGVLAVMQFITKAWNSKYPNENVYIRDATDEAIIAEITKAKLPMASWRRIVKEDLPTSRENRDAWRDDGVTIAVDPTKIVGPTPEVIRKAEFAALPVTVDLTDKLKNATPAQIDNWLLNNVTTLSQARTVLGTMLKYMATRI